MPFQSIVASAFCLKGKNNSTYFVFGREQVASAFCLKGKNNLLTSKRMKLGE